MQKRRNDNVIENFDSKSKFNIWRCLIGKQKVSIRSFNNKRTHLLLKRKAIRRYEQKVETFESKWIKIYDFKIRPKEDRLHLCIVYICS